MAAKLIPDSIRDVLDYNPDTGVFTWLVSPSRNVKAGDIAGSLDGKGYRRVGYKGVQYLCHRLAWFFVHNEQPPMVDHAFHDPADNRLKNLRASNHRHNGRNRKNSRGVAWYHKRQRGRVYTYAIAYYGHREVYTGKSILLAWHHRIMAEREDHPISLPHLRVEP